MIIGIGGGSCSGKSLLTDKLSKTLEDSSIIHFDDFFVGKRNLVGGEVENWENPELYRLDGYLKVLQNLRNGKETIIEANSRESRKLGIDTVRN